MFQLALRIRRVVKPASGGRVPALTTVVGLRTDSGTHMPTAIQALQRLLEGQEAGAST